MAATFPVRPCTLLGFDRTLALPTLSIPRSTAGQQTCREEGEEPVRRRSLVQPNWATL